MIRFLLILCLWFTPAWAADTTLSPLDQAKQNMSAGYYAKALSTLRSLVAEEENNYEAWFLFGVAQVHEQQPHPAIEAFRHVIELRPTLAEPHNNLAAVYNNLGDTKAAIKELEVALEKRPNYAVAEENLADLYIKRALQYYRSSLNHNPNPTVEKRYARLLHVRNPSASAEPNAVAEHKAPEQTPAPKEAKATPMAKPTVIIAGHTEATKTVEAAPMIQPTVIIAGQTEAKETEKPSVIQDKAEATPSIAEDMSITGVLDALEIWRKAWSSQDLDTYFSAYASDYQPDSRFADISAWKAYKTRVIRNKTFINVTFEKVEVDIPASRDVAEILVLQHFRSNTYVGDDRKKITLKYTPQGWKIVAEVSLP